MCKNNFFALFVLAIFTVLGVRIFSLMDLFYQAPFEVSNRLAYVIRNSKSDVI